MRVGVAGIVATVGIVLLAAAATARAEEGFQTGRYYAGPRVWLGNLNGAVAIGAQVERGFTQPGAAGSGILAGGIGVDRYGWSYDYTPFGSYDYSVVPVQVFANYHFLLKNNKRIDPYAGLALVYEHVSASWSGSGLASASADGSSTGFAGQAGLRYFVSESLSLQGQVGFGYGTIGLGATWRL